MTDQELTNYIKTTLGSGFPEDQIEEALLGAGWNRAEIARGFAAASGSPRLAGGRNKALLAVIVVLAALPLLGYGGFLFYEKQIAGREQSPAAAPATAVRGETDQGPQRDMQRLRDVESLQTALAAHKAEKKIYPQNLASLVDAGYLSTVPSDPKSKDLYLYNPLGQPPLFYSLTFVLEAGVGQLEAGLTIVSPEKTVSAEKLLEQEEVIKGARILSPSPEIAITDLSRAPFYPGEEAAVEVAVDPGVNLRAAFLVMGELKLTDANFPFRFSFSVPGEPGQYAVNVIGVDAGGNIYFRQTGLVVNREN